MIPSTQRQSEPLLPPSTRFDPVRIVVLAGALFWFIFVRTSVGKTDTVTSTGMARVTLSQKDGAFVPIPRSAGGATGVVWYARSGPALRFTLRALGLAPARRYILEIQADETIYSVASYLSNAGGEIALDTALTTFAEGECVGANYDAPRSVSGEHRVKFWIKRDGNPANGTSPGARAGTPGASIPCHGNGDGDYAYMLMENEVADFTGAAAAR